ncbi:flavin reductase [Micromonospora sp. KC606]|uniref:flavin reductase n=1 Tax=Micromonospora sp. KC606 TaxID=2530379 RepID=UPI0024417641|nr:flavin reductase [Micromonospora sp. KC606]
MALLTGSRNVPPHKRAKGYRHEADKFAAAGLTPVPSDKVSPPRVAECLIQLEATVNRIHAFGEPDSGVVAVDVQVVQVHVEENLLMPGTNRYLDPDKWDPLIMKFLEFYGGGHNLHPSRLAEGWGAPRRDSQLTAPDR